MITLSVLKLNSVKENKRNRDGKDEMPLLGKRNVVKLKVQLCPTQKHTYSSSATVSAVLF
jgi:hypothetical protein